MSLMNSGNPKMFRVLGPAIIAALVVGIVFSVSALGKAQGESAIPWLNHPVKIPVAAAQGRAGTAVCGPQDISARLIRHGIVQDGTYAYVYAATNVSGTTCYASGYPRITVAGKAVSPGPDVLSLTAGDLKPGQSATFALTQTVRAGCTAGATGNGIMRQSAQPALMSISADRSRAIGTVLISKCTKNSVTVLGLAPTEPKPDALSRLSVRLDLPATATAGKTLNFTVVLSNPTTTPVRLSPCPGYEVGLSVAGERAYRLNCAHSVIAPGQSEVFGMQYAIPAGAHTGLAKIGWLLLNPQRTGSGTVITITH